MVVVPKHYYASPTILSFFVFVSKLWEGKKNKGLRQNHDRELVSLLALKESELHRFIFISSDMSNKIIYVCQPVHIPIATYPNYCKFVQFGDGDYIYLKQKMTFSKRLLLQCSTVITEVNWFVVFTFVWLVLWRHQTSMHGDLFFVLEILPGR